MNFLLKTFAALFIFSICFTVSANTVKLATAKVGANQTNGVSTVLPETSLPFRIVIRKMNFQLPVGIHSGVFGVYKGLWILIGGRINGLHGFGLTNNFPPDQQNNKIFVINPTSGVSYSRQLNDPSSGLTQAQIDSLTVTSAQMYQDGNTLYTTGGYGVDTMSGLFSTKPVLTAINLPGIVDWVMQPGNPNFSVIKNIRQIGNPIFQIAGGEMFRLGNVTELVFGQNFIGQYTTNSNGIYSDQVRQFQIKNVNGQMTAVILPSVPAIPNPSFRRRDLNILPALLNVNNQLQNALIAYGGVFTVSAGVWTVPVVINGKTDPVMADPDAASTFKQAMNQYVAAAASLYSRRFASMYHIIFGGMSYGFFSGGTFQTDTEIPFINEVTTIKRDQNGNYTQYLMSGQYPVIISTGSNPGNQLLFGAGAYFIPAKIAQYPNGVINLDSLRQATVIGYIVGGIQSTVPNTSSNSDSAASPYVFAVTLVPTTSLSTAARSSRLSASDHAIKLAALTHSRVAHSRQKYNRKYHELSSQPMQQSHHLA